MNNPKVAIMSINAQLALADVEAAIGLEAKIKAGMKAVLAKNWMDTDDDSMMRAALSAVLLDVGLGSEDGKRLLASMDALRKLSALVTAAQAGLLVDLQESDIPPESNLPLLGWWHEAKAGVSQR